MRHRPLLSRLHDDSDDMKCLISELFVSDDRRIHLTSALAIERADRERMMSHAI